MLIAEAFVLLSLDPSGRPARGSSSREPAQTGVTGALLAELGYAGCLSFDRGRIDVTGTRPFDPLLAQVLDEAARFDGKKLTSRLGAIRHSGWSEVVDRMVDEGMVGRERPALGPTRHPVLDVGTHAHLLAGVQAAARGTEPLDPFHATLLALAGPCHLLEVVAPDRGDRRHAKHRIAEATALVPVAKAVKHVIDSNAASTSTAATMAT